MKKLHAAKRERKLKIKNVRGEVEAINIISKCKNCGKLKDHVVPVMSNRY